MGTLLQNTVFGRSKYKPFVSTWNTGNISTGSSANNQVKLPLESVGTYAFTVYWGDGTSNFISSWNQTETTHTYSTIGTYQITILGKCKGWRFDNTGDRLKFLSVKTWGSISLGNNSGYFRGCGNFDSPDTEDILDLSTTTICNSFFAECSKLTMVGRLNDWDFSKVISVQAMFYCATNFDQYINSLDFSSVVNMSNFMNSASNFNQELSNLNVSKVANMSFCFIYATKFNKNIGNWNVSNCADFTEFMTGKNTTNFSASNLDAIYNGWSSRSVKTPITIKFGTAKYTSASSAGRAILTGAPNNWTITDGGI